VAVLLLGRGVDGRTVVLPINTATLLVVAVLSRGGLAQENLELGEGLRAYPEGEVPDLWTGRAEKPISSASDPSTWSGRLWTGKTHKPA
jgi:hypothetical protein